MVEQAPFNSKRRFLPTFAHHRPCSLGLAGKALSADLRISLVGTNRPIFSLGCRRDFRGKLHFLATPPMPSLHRYSSWRKIVLFTTSAGMREMFAETAYHNKVALRAFFRESPNTAAEKPLWPPANDLAQRRSFLVSELVLGFEELLESIYVLHQEHLPSFLPGVNARVRESATGTTLIRPNPSWRSCHTYGERLQPCEHFLPTRPRLRRMPRSTSNQDP